MSLPVLLTVITRYMREMLGSTTNMELSRYDMTFVILGCRMYARRLYISRIESVILEFIFFFHLLRITRKFASDQRHTQWRM